MTRPDDPLPCTCGHPWGLHWIGEGGQCDACACLMYAAQPVRCYACGRDVQRDPWPHHGFLCGHCDEYSRQQAGL